LRFRVRALIVVELLIGGWLVRSAHIQRDAVAAIETAGGVALYDWRWSNGTYNPAGKPWAPEWLVDLIGVDFFGHVTVASLPSRSAAIDRVMAQVGRLTQLEGLSLTGCSVSDTALAHLKRLTSLFYLNLDRTDATDVGLAHLKRLTNFSSLHLGSTRVTDAGPAQLTGWTSLQQLNLQGTLVTNAGVQELENALPKAVISR
jgi:hypothetical protein